MLTILIVVILVLLLVGGLPTWGYWRGGGYGYYPSGIIGVILIILVIYLLVGGLR